MKVRRSARVRSVMLGSVACVALAMAACTESEPPTDPADARVESRETVFDPLVETLDRAEGVQQTIDDRAAELRRRLEEEEGARD